jgi:predicted MPP superfamily phosphohydrolase
MMLITFAIVIIPYSYVAWRLINAVAMFYPQYHRTLKIVIPVIFLLLNLLPIISGIAYLLGQYRNLFYFSDHFSIFDLLILIPYWIGLIIVLEILPYFLASDLFLLVSRWFSASLKTNLAKWIALIKIALIVLFVIFVSIRTYLDTTKISISEYKIPVKNLPPGFEELNLVLTADVQIDKYTPEQKSENFSQIIRKLKPDLLFFAGDLVTSGTFYIDQGVDVLCDTEAKLARIACVGDHDIWSDAGRIAAGIQNCGWDFLDDQHKTVSYKDKKILVTGVSYVYSKRISLPALKELLQSAPDADLKILIVHQPSKMVIEIAAEFGYDVLLAGHTHGGQIIFRPFGFTITPTQMENDIFTGFYEKNDMHVIITNGIGVSLVPIRYRAQGEIVQFRLKRAE